MSAGRLPAGARDLHQHLLAANCLGWCVARTAEMEKIEELSSACTLIAHFQEFLDVALESIEEPNGGLPTFHSREAARLLCRVLLAACQHGDG